MNARRDDVYAQAWEPAASYARETERLSAKESLLAVSFSHLVPCSPSLQDEWIVGYSRQKKLKTQTIF